MFNLQAQRIRQLKWCIMIEAVQLLSKWMLIKWSAKEQLKIVTLLKGRVQTEVLITWSALGWIEILVNGIGGIGDIGKEDGKQNRWEGE